MSNEVTVVDVLKAAAELISQGRWDGVTQNSALQMTIVVQEIAKAINTLEAEEVQATVVPVEDYEGDEDDS